jgi:hypothetical protein
LGVFDALAALWTAIWNGAPLPCLWLHIRMAFIPKPDGSGDRPLGIAQLAWRIGMASVIHQLTPWMALWAPPELHGGLKDRDARALHEEMFEAFEDGLDSHRRFAGFKADVRKCFDTIRPEQALAVLTRLGAPIPLVSVLQSFYAHQLRWIDNQGCTAAAPVQPLRSLIAGCPSSCFLLAAIMSGWVHHVASAEVRVGGYIDDRTVWTTARVPAPLLERAAQRTQEFDASAGLAWHLDKGEVFALTLAARRTLVPLTQTVCPT